MRSRAGRRASRRRAYAIDWSRFVDRQAHDAIRQVLEAKLLIRADCARVVGMHVEAQLGRAFATGALANRSDELAEHAAAARLGCQIDELDPPVRGVRPIAPLGADRDRADRRAG